jgi:hypothetical protein
VIMLFRITLPILAVANFFFAGRNIGMHKSCLLNVISGSFVLLVYLFYYVKEESCELSK